MKRVKITVMRITQYADLMAEYENPIEHTCDMQLGQTFVVENCTKPEAMCESAWQTLLPFVRELAEGGGNFFDGWMKNPPLGDAVVQRRLPPRKLPRRDDRLTAQHQIL